VAGGTSSLGAAGRRGEEPLCLSIREATSVSAWRWCRLDPNDYAKKLRIRAHPLAETCRSTPV